MNWLLRLFGIDDREKRDCCPYCQRPFDKPIPLQRTAEDAYLDGASVEWFEAAVAREMRSDDHRTWMSS
jgi:hypothetical protein